MAANWFSGTRWRILGGSRRSGRDGKRIAQRSNEPLAARQIASPARARRSPISHPRLSQRQKIDPDPESTAQIDRFDQDHRCDRAQSEEHRCRNAARRFHVRNRRFRLGQIDSDSRCALSKFASGQGRDRQIRKPGACKIGHRRASHR